MQITETNLQFKQLHPRKVTQRIILHHSASVGDEDAATIHKWHLGQSWAGIGYHFVIRKSGEIQRGRPEIMVGAHAGSTGNPNSIGICLIGHFDRHKPTPEQMASLVWLINYLRSKYGFMGVIGHKDVMSTACPGALFPWDELRATLDSKPFPPLPQPQQVKLTINGRPADVPLRVVNGRTEAQLSGAWVQLRDLAEMLHAGVEWDEQTRTANIVIK